MLFHRQCRYLITEYFRFLPPVPYNIAVIYFTSICYNHLIYCFNYYFEQLSIISIKNKKNKIVCFTYICSFSDTLPSFMNKQVVDILALLSPRDNLWLVLEEH